MKQDIGQLHISMDDVESPDVLDALHNLLHDHPRLLLANVTSAFEQDSQVVAIRVLLHHVDI